MTTTIVSELGGIIFKFLIVKMKMTAHEWSFDGKFTKIQGRTQFYNDQWCIICCLIIINRKQVLWYFVVYQLVLLFVLYIMCIVCWSSSVSMMEHNFLTTQHIPVYWNIDLIRFVTYLLVPCFSFSLTCQSKMIITAIFTDFSTERRKYFDLWL